MTSRLKKMVNKKVNKKWCGTDKNFVKKYPPSSWSTGGARIFLSKINGAVPRFNGSAGHFTSFILCAQYNTSTERIMA